VLAAAGESGRGSSATFLLVGNSEIPWFGFCCPLGGKEKFGVGGA
jgi:hypothetical protein